MKALRSSLLVFSGFVFAVLLLGLGLHVRAGSSPSPSGNGDVNGDGTIDLSDAVYTLLYLFKGGPAPVACADTPELVGRVAALEDTNSRIATALEELAHPCRERADRFVDNGDGTVTDTCTGLMWQQVPENPPRTFADATAYLASLDLAGHADWRLPTARELGDIILDRPTSNTHHTWMFGLDPSFGVASVGRGFWTSTPIKGQTPLAVAAFDYYLLSDSRASYSDPLLVPQCVDPTVCSHEPFHILAVRGP